MSAGPTLTILGGGVTALSAAYLAARAGARVRVIEAGERMGGLLNTFPVFGNRLEYYYHHFFTHDAEIHWLLGELGLRDRLFYRSTSMGIYHGGVHYAFNGLADLMRYRPVGWCDKLRFALSSLYLGHGARWEAGETVTAAEWLRRYAGRTSWESIWEPMLKVKFGAYAESVPLSWLIGRLRQRLHSRKSGDERLGYLNGSLQLLTDTLCASLEKMGVELISGASVESLEVREGKLQRVRTSQGDFEDERFLCTLPQPVLADLLKPVAPDFASSLAEIDYFSAICVVLEMKASLSDYYWLNVAEPGCPFGGVIEHTHFVGVEYYGGRHLAYLSRYHEPDHALAKQSCEQVRETFLAALPTVFPDKDLAMIQEAHVFRARHAAPICGVNFSKLIPACKSPVERLFLANMTHVYPDERSVNNSIRVAAEACRCMGLGGEAVPVGSSMAGLIGFR